MSAYHTPYEFTQQGRVESWTRQKREQRYDFQGAIERQGIKTACRMMREEMRKENDNEKSV